MKTLLAILTGIGLAVAVGAARAAKPLIDYSFIRGANYGMNADQAAIRAFACDLGLTLKEYCLLY